MRVVDSSIVIAAITHGDPALRTRCRDEVERATAVVAHVLAEAYARVSAFPGPMRRAPSLARRTLREMFPHDPLTLSGSGYLRVLDLVADRGIPGGAIYDCLIAETAREHKATLVSLDKRAATNYAIVGAEYVLL